MSMGWFKTTKGRVEFIRMKGPEGKGYAEVAVSRNTLDDNDNWTYPQSGGVSLGCNLLARDFS